MTLKPNDYDQNGDIIPDSVKEEQNKFPWWTQIFNQELLQNTKEKKTMEKICKNCEYYRNKFGYGQCYGQKNAPQVDDNECCEGFKERTDKINSEDFTKAFGKGVEEKSTTYREQFVGETDEQYGEYKKAHDNLFNNLEEELAKARIGFTKNDLKDAIADEFKYRASQGRTNYSMEEVIYIVNEVIDEINWER